jgi:hypothetical protein
MATGPTPEESARLILSFFKDHNRRAGEALMLDLVNTEFSTRGGRADDFNAGMEYALDQGWIEMPSSNAMRLTDAGFAAM